MYDLSHSQYSKAAEQNFPTSLFNLAVLVYHGTGCVADQARALDFYARAAKRDFIEAMFNLAQHFERVAHRTHGRQLGNDDSEDEDDFTYDDPGRPLAHVIADSEAARTALMWLERAAASKMRTNQYVLSAIVQAGVFRLAGMGCHGAVPDRDRAVKWFKIAHDLGEDEGSFRFGAMLLHFDSAASREQGIDILKRISRSKSEWKSDALFELGLYFLRHPASSAPLSSLIVSSQGDDQSSDDHASSLLLKAAILSHGRAALELGRLCERNSDLAAKLGRAAIPSSSSSPDNAYFPMLSQESSASRVTTRAAFSWFKIAARRGVAEAQRLLSECYASGSGTTADAGKAQRWRAAFAASRAPFSAGAAVESSSFASTSALPSSSKTLPSAAASEPISRAATLQHAEIDIDEAYCGKSTSSSRSRPNAAKSAAVIDLLDDEDVHDDDEMQGSATSSASASVSAPASLLSAPEDEVMESDQDAQSDEEDGQQDDDEQSEPEAYEVERITAMRHYKGVQQFKIKWKGYADSASTWEPRENIERGASDILREFEAAKSARGNKR